MTHASPTARLTTTSRLYDSMLMTARLAMSTQSSKKNDQVIEARTQKYFLRRNCQDDSQQRQKTQVSWNDTKLFQGRSFSGYYV